MKGYKAFRSGVRSQRDEVHVRSVRSVWSARGTLNHGDAAAHLVTMSPTASERPVLTGAGPTLAPDASGT